MCETNGLNYRQIFQYEYPVEGEQPQKNILGSKLNRVCTFCGKGKPEVTFKKEAHVIPAALGNRRLFNYCECDNCNENKFSVYENELVNMLQLDRIFIRGRPRSGAPKYKPVNSNSFITSTPGTNQVQISVQEGEGSFELIELDNNQMMIKIKPLSYNPASVCKALVHMAWSVLDENIRNKYTYVLDWLQGNVDIFPLYLDKAFIPGNGMAYVILEIWESIKDESSDYPLFIRFTYGFSVLTFYLPKDTNTHNKRPERFIFYRSIPNDIIVTVDSWVINEDKRITPNSCEYTFKYKHRI